MKSKIIQEFKGKINDIEVNDENIYYSTNFILKTIEDKFDECYTDEFVKDLIEIIKRIHLKYLNFSFSILENDFYDCIQVAENFEKIQFKYFGTDWMFEWLNDNIKTKKYNKN